MIGCPHEINEAVHLNENGMNKVRITRYNQYKTVDCLYKNLGTLMKQF